MTVADIEAPDRSADGPADSLGGLIRSTRLLRGLTQAELAATIGVTGRTVGNWERGDHDVPAEAMPLIAAALGVRFEVDAAGWRVYEQGPAPTPITPEAVHALLDRLGVPRTPTE